MEMYKYLFFASSKCILSINLVVNRHTAGIEPLADWPAPLATAIPAKDGTLYNT